MDNEIFGLMDVHLKDRLVGVDLRIQKGECWHFLGPNGAGKSSLLLLLAGIEKPSGGRLTLKHAALSQYSLAQLALSRCFLHQQMHSEFDIPLGQLLGFYTHSSSVPAQIDDCLHITPFLHKPLSGLSGGQQQRFHIARNLSQIWSEIEKGEGLILLDEPLSHLDIQYQSEIMLLLQKLRGLGNTIIMSSHDINLTAKYASHVGLMKQQRLIFKGDTADVMSVDNLHHIFDHRFVHIKGLECAQNYLVSASNQSI